LVKFKAPWHRVAILYTDGFGIIVGLILVVNWSVSVVESEDVAHHRCTLESDRNDLPAGT
jgi:hypothetical protein